jgi:pyruvate dehydrogenase E1 component
MSSASRVPGLIFEALQERRRGVAPSESWILEQLFPGDRARPMVTVLDGHPHTLAFLATIHSVSSATLGVSRFGQSGDIADVYRYHEIDADSIIRATLDLTQ